MQQINLYAALEKPSPYAMSAKRAKLIFIRVLFLIIFVVLAQAVEVFAKKIYFYNLSHNEATLTQTLQSELFTPTEKKPFENYAQQVLYQDKLMDKIEKYQEKVPFQPANMLSAIALTINKDVAITKINIENQGKTITITGEAINSIQVLNFEKDLRLKSPFRKVVFKTVSIKEQANKDLMKFVLSTKDKEPT